MDVTSAYVNHVHNRLDYRHFQKELEHNKKRGLYVGYRKTLRRQRTTLVRDIGRGLTHTEKAARNKVNDELCSCASPPRPMGGFVECVSLQGACDGRRGTPSAQHFRRKT